MPLLYAREVIELMAAHPGRDFRMIELYRYVAAGRDLTMKQKRAMREALHRVTKGLQETGSVLILAPAARRGGYALYRWLG
jgi:predicted Zn-ribbon and HTH transcriptional regulator